MRRLLKSGFGLLEAVIALAIAGGATLILAQIIGQATKNQKRLSGGLDFDLKMWEVLGIFLRSNTCTTTTNQVFKYKSENSLSVAKYGAATHEVNWLGYQVDGRTVKVLEEGDSVGPRLIQSISFSAKKDDAGNLLPVLNSTPVSGQSTHEIMLKIQAAMPNGSWPIEKTFSFQIVTNNTNSDIVGCSSVPGQPLPDIPTPNGRFPASFMCNDISAGGLKWSIGFHFHAVEYRADRTIKSIRYRDGTGGRYMDFNSNGSFQDTDTNSSCRNKSISQLTQEVTPPP